MYLLESVPKLGPIISGPFVELMKHQKATLHNRQETDVPSVSISDINYSSKICNCLRLLPCGINAFSHCLLQSQEGGMVASILEKFVMGMVIYFVISIINAMAQSYHKRMTKEKIKLKS